MNGSYIGVTGFSTLEEVAAFEAISENVDVPAGYEICPGVLVSQRAITGSQASAPRFPTFDTAIELLQRLGSEYTAVVHFSSRDAGRLEDDLELFLNTGDLYSSGACRRVQLNVGDPSAEALRRLRTLFPRVELVLQLPLWRSDLASVDSIRNYIAQYSGTVDFLLIDPSGGRGKGLSFGALERSALALTRASCEFSVGIAGGFSADTVAEAVATARRYFGKRALSVDAEGKLRGGRHMGEKVGDRMNPTKMEEYLAAAVLAVS